MPDSCDCMGDKIPHCIFRYCISYLAYVPVCIYVGTVKDNCLCGIPQKVTGSLCTSGHFSVNGVHGHISADSQ